MPEISRFFGIVIRIYNREHGVPNCWSSNGRSCIGQNLCKTGNGRRTICRSQRSNPSIEVNMWRIERFELRGDFRIWVQFSDGISGEVDLTPDLWGEVGAPLLVPEFFAQVSLDECGVLAWPNGFDVAPDVLHAELAGP